jgi:hypothetical protein
MLTTTETSAIAFRFDLLQQVECECIAEDGDLTWVDAGMIVGRTLMLPNAMPGNWYLVKWHSLPGDSHFPLSHYCWEHEDYLRPK